MHETQLLHKLLQESSAIGHIKREEALLTCIESVLTGANLTVTEMGRRAKGQAFVKHKIKQTDRLVGNRHLNKESKQIYQCSLNYLKQPNLTILIDWSQIDHHGHHVLRASVYLKKRSITLYEELHAEKLLGNSQIQKAFLATLKDMLPSETHLTILADAGFKTDFFQAVLSFNWDFIVRVRSNMLFQAAEQAHWIPCPDLYQQATSKPAYVGAGSLSKQTKTRAHLYLYQGYRPGKKKKKRSKNRTQSKCYSKRHKQPWLIASSLKKPARWIVNQYKKRMKIEHEFRDIKDRNWGLGLKHSKSRGAVRISNLLLIAHLVCFLLWCTGLWAEQQGLHRQFQSNSQSQQRVLSLVFLGSLIVHSDRHHHMLRSLKNIRAIIQEAMDEVYDV